LFINIHFIIFELDNSSLSDTANFSLLNRDFVTKLINVFVSLVQNFHQSFIFLKVDHFEPVIEVVLSQQLLSLLIFNNFIFDYFAFSILDMTLENIGFSHYLGLSLFMEVIELLGVLDDLVDEISMSISLSSFLATSHILLNIVNSASFLLILSR